MVNIVIEVEDGMVQNVYADNRFINVEVIDLDISDYPDDDEIEEKDENVERLKQIRKSGEFHCVW